MLPEEWSCWNNGLLASKRLMPVSNHKSNQTAEFCFRRLGGFLCARTDCDTDATIGLLFYLSPERTDGGPTLTNRLRIPKDVARTATRKKPT